MFVRCSHTMMAVLLIESRSDTRHITSICLLFVIWVGWVSCILRYPCKLSFNDPIAVEGAVATNIERHTASFATMQYNRGPYPS